MILPSYLSGYKQILKILNDQSNPLSVPSDMILGEYLSNSVFKYSTFLLITEHIQIYFTINHISDCFKLQSDWDRFSSRCSANGLYLNTDKCMQIISFYHKRPPKYFDYI